MWLANRNGSVTFGWYNIIGSPASVPGTGADRSRQRERIPWAKAGAAAASRMAGNRGAGTFAHCTQLNHTLDHQQYRQEICHVVNWA